MLILELIHTVYYYICLIARALLKAIILIFTGRTCKHCTYYIPDKGKCDVYGSSKCYKSLTKKNFTRKYYLKHNKEIDLNTILITCTCFLIWFIIYCLFIYLY